MENVNEALKLIAQAQESIKLHQEKNPHYDNTIADTLYYLQRAIDKLTTK